VAVKLLALAAVVSVITGGAAAPSLRAVDLQPLTVRGVGFKQQERVKLLVSLPTHAATRLVRADARGRFRITFSTRLDRCDSAVVQARGARGSRATLQLDALDCASP
jgi:hypothetical protein